MYPSPACIASEQFGRVGFHGAVWGFRGLAVYGWIRELRGLGLLVLSAMSDKSILLHPSLVRYKRLQPSDIAFKQNRIKVPAKHLHPKCPKCPSPKP